jgi:hypothetical protein
MITNYNKFLNEKKYTHKTLNTEIDDIHLTGSLANYNYNKYSDLDIHITVDLDEYDGDKDIIDDLGKSKAFIWNLKHDIVIRGADVELYVMDKNEKHISTGLYSLLNNEWVKKPEYTDPEVDDKDVESKYNRWKYEIEKLYELTKDKNLSDSDNKSYLDRTEKLKKKLKKFRKKGLEDGGGEFSTENVAFKKLRNNKIIEKLYDASTIFYDRMFSQ